MEDVSLVVQLSQKDSFKRRVAYLLSQHAVAIFNAGGPDPDDLTFAKKIICSGMAPAMFPITIADAVTLILAGSENVKLTVQRDTNGDVYTTVADVDLASQIATYWHMFATSGF